MTITAEAPTHLVKPVTCRRCQGAGDVVSRVVYNGMPGGCFTCAGHGFVEGDRATLAARKAAAAARLAIRRWAPEAAMEAGMKRHQALDLVYALDHLEENAPERHAQALASHAAGHPGLLVGLVEYAAAQGFLRYGARLLTVTEARALVGA